MKIDCLLAGVGGQGTVLASKIIAQTAMNSQSFVRTSETIGMAQRGGCVVSHVRTDAKHCSSDIPKGMADLIIGFEPAEVVRNMEFLRPKGRILVNINPIIPVTASLEEVSYKVEDILEFLRDIRTQVIFVDGQKLCQIAGSPKVLNVIMLGVAIKEQLLPFSKEGMLHTIQEILPQKLIEQNKTALEVGYCFEQYHHDKEVV